METVKASQQFIKLHQSDDNESIVYVKAKGIDCVEGNGQGGTIVQTLSSTVVVSESPEEVLELMDGVLDGSSAVTFERQADGLYQQAQGMVKD